MKLYFGIRFSKHVVWEINHAIRKPLLGLPHSLRVPKPSYWHLTTHFIGEVTPRSANEIIRRMKSARAPFVGTIRLGGVPPVGTFGKNILFVRVEDESGVLHSLNEWGKELAPVRSHARFEPHITVARNPKDEEWNSIVEHLSAQKLSLSIPVREVLLLQSKEVRGMKHHRVLAKKALLPIGFRSPKSEH
ncbi:MAG: 2'-5' RNA ligase family protein [archaeon]